MWPRNHSCWRYMPRLCSGHSIQGCVTEKQSAPETSTHPLVWSQRQCCQSLLELGEGLAVNGCGQNSPYTELLEVISLPLGRDSWPRDDGQHFGQHQA